MARTERFQRLPLRTTSGRERAAAIADAARPAWSPCRADSAELELLRRPSASDEFRSDSRPVLFQDARPCLAHGFVRPASRKSPRNVGEREGGVVVGRPRQGRPAFRASVLVGGANGRFKPIGWRIASRRPADRIECHRLRLTWRYPTHAYAMPRVSRKLLVHAADGRKGGNTCRRVDATAADHEVSPRDRPARDRHPEHHPSAAVRRRLRQMSTKPGEDQCRTGARAWAAPPGDVRQGSHSCADSAREQALR